MELKVANIKLFLSIFAILFTGWVIKTYLIVGNFEMPFGGWELSDWVIFLVLMPVIFVLYMLIDSEIKEIKEGKKDDRSE